MSFSAHSVSPSGSSREDGELRSDSRKRPLDPNSTAGRAPLPQPLPESSGRRFQGQRENRPVRYAEPNDWRKVALEQLDLKRLAEKNCELNDMRAEHFEGKSIELEKEVDEARQKIQRLETQLGEAQSSASTWQQKAAETEQQLQQASRDNKEFESQLSIVEQSLLDKQESEKKLTDRVSELIAQRDQAMKEYEASKKATQEKLANLRGHYEKHQKASEQTIGTLRKEKAQLSGTSKAQETSIEQLKVQCHRANEAKTAAENKLAEIQQRLAETQQKLDEEVRTTANLRYTLGMIRAQVDARLIKQEKRT